jgi:hypothetical protein
MVFLSGVENTLLNKKGKQKDVYPIKIISFSIFLELVLCQSASCNLQTIVSMRRCFWVFYNYSS